MGWLRLVGSLKLYVSFVEYCLFYRSVLQKRPVILRSLLYEVTLYLYHLNHIYTHDYVRVCMAYEFVFYIYIHICAYVYYVHICTRVCVCVCVCVGVCVCLCVCVCVCVCVCCCVYIYIYIGICI